MQLKLFYETVIKKKTVKWLKCLQIDYEQSDYICILCMSHSETSKLPTFSC